MAELYRGRISTVFSTDTYMKVRVNRSSKFDCHLHQFANANLIKFSKWIILEDLSIIVCVQEFTCIITRVALCHLCKVVCTEAEEVSFFSDFISSKSCSYS